MIGVLLGGVVARGGSSASRGAEDTDAVSLCGGAATILVLGLALGLLLIPRRVGVAS